MKETLRYLRKEQTRAEKLLWDKLRNRKFNGYKFRRQYPVEGFILDFYCAELKLGIELDGRVHEKQKEYDEFRQDMIENTGIKIIRFKNDEIEQNIKGVLEHLTRFYSVSITYSENPLHD